MRSSPAAVAHRWQAGSRKYVTLKRPDGDFYFVGKAGALRFGKSVTGSMAAPDDFKKRLLEEAGR